MSRPRHRRRLVLGPHGTIAWCVLLLAAAVAEAALLVQRTDEWRTSWIGAVLWHAGSARLVAPVLAAVAAAVASEVRRSSVASVAMAAGRERALVARLALQAAGAGVLVHVAGFVVVVVAVRANGLDGGPPVLAALPGTFAIAAWAVVGAVLGWRLRSFAAAPLAALLGFIVLVLVAYGPEDPLREDHRVLVCVGERPSACVYPERRSAALETRARLVELSATIDRLIPGAVDGIDRWAEGWGRPSPRLAALTRADPDDTLLLAQDVVAAAGRCGAAEVDGVLQLWIARRSGLGAEFSPAHVGYDVPPDLLAGPRLDREARRAADRIRGRCR